MHGGVLWCVSLHHGMWGGIPLYAAHPIWMGIPLSIWGHRAQQSQVFDRVISRTKIEMGASMGFVFCFHADSCSYSWGSTYLFLSNMAYIFWWLGCYPMMPSVQVPRHGRLTLDSWMRHSVSWAGGRRSSWRIWWVHNLKDTNLGIVCSTIKVAYVPSPGSHLGRWLLGRCMIHFWWGNLRCYICMRDSGW